MSHVASCTIDETYLDSASQISHDTKGGGAQYTVYAGSSIVKKTNRIYVLDVTPL